MANLADFLGMEFGDGTGGYGDGAESPQQVHLRISPLLGLGSVRICPLVEFLSQSRDVRSSFRVDRGRIEEKGLGMGTVVAGSLPTWFGSHLGWQATAGLSFRDWDLKGRRLLVEEEVRVEEIHRARHSAHLFGSLGIKARFGLFGLMTGLGTRPQDEADFFGFISLGLRHSG